MSEKILSRPSIRLRQIAELLVLNSNLLANPGLLNGKIGISIFLYHYAKFNANPSYATYAGDLIDDVYEQVSMGTPIDFSNGLTGIGWGIEYLAQQGFIEADTNEVLQVLDDKVTRTLTEQSPLGNVNDIISIGFYLLSRYKGQRTQVLNPFTVTHRNQLIFLADVSLNLLNNKRSESEQPFPNLATLNSLIYIIIQMHVLGLITENYQLLLRSLVSHMNGLLKEDVNPTQELRLLYIHVASIIHIVADDKLASGYRTILSLIEHRLKKCLDNVEDIDNFVLASLHSLVYGIDLDTFYNEYEIVYSNVLRVVHDESDWGHRLASLNDANLGLAKLAGVGLAMLNLKQYAWNNDF